jgi:antitoxin component YwqK of YwqJK toxin-antitoxin module
LVFYGDGIELGAHNPKTIACRYSLNDLVEMRQRLKRIDELSITKPSKRGLLGSNIAIAICLILSWTVMAEENKKQTQKGPIERNIVTDNTTEKRIEKRDGLVYHYGTTELFAGIHIETGVELLNSLNELDDQLKRKYERRVIRYQDGVRHGTLQVFYTNGQCAFEIPYHNGKQNGKVVCKDENGFLVEERLVENGITVMVRKWWQTSHRPKSEKWFRDGIQNGPVKLWFENGALESEANVKDGQPHGLVKGYSKFGAVQMMGLYYHGEHIREFSGYEIGRYNTDRVYRDDIDQYVKTKVSP